MYDGSHKAGLGRLVQSLDLLAAVREHGSFAGAAQILGIDPSVVSHRVRTLEDELHLRLFNRTTCRVRPTRAGLILTDAAIRSLAGTDRALAVAWDLRSARSIRLSVHSSLAMKWLVPRRSTAENAGLDLSIDIREGLETFDGSDVDAGFRFGVGPYPGLHTTRLGNCYLQPVIGSAHPAARLPAPELAGSTTVTLLSDRGAEQDRTAGLPLSAKSIEMP